MNEIERLLLDSPDTLVVIRTDGKGRVLRVQGQTREAGVEIADAVDIAIAAVDNFARSSDGLGRFQTGVLMCEHGTVFLGQLSNGHAIALVAASNANLGLLLNQIRRLVAEESGLADYAA